MSCSGQISCCLQVFEVVTSRTRSAERALFRKTGPGIHASLNIFYRPFKEDLHLLTSVHELHPSGPSSTHAVPLKFAPRVTQLDSHLMKLFSGLNC